MTEIYKTVYSITRFLKIFAEDCSLSDFPVDFPSESSQLIKIIIAPEIRTQLVTLHRRKIFTCPLCFWFFFLLYTQSSLLPPNGFLNFTPLQSDQF